LNTQEILSSGIIESYCLGLVSQEEQREIETLALEHPEIRSEIDKVNYSLELLVSEDAIAPPPSVKNKLMLQIYDLESGTGKKFPPLIKENTTVQDFRDWLTPELLMQPELDSYENLHTQDLPTTEHVTNFAVWAKQGHDDEDHNDFLEYIVILKGSCDMIMDGVRHHFKEGEIIRIPKDCVHHAEITSEEPMVAIVQRVAA